MKKTTAKRLVVALVIVVVAAGIGYAAVETFMLTEGTHLAADDGPEVELDQDVDLESHPHPFPDEYTVDLEPYGKINSSGPTSLRLGDLDEEVSTVRDIDTNGETLTVSLSESNRVDLSGQIDSYDVSAIEIGDSFYFEASGDWTLTIHDLDEDTPVLAVADGSILDYDRTDDDGEVTFELEDGSGDVELVEGDPPEIDEETASPTEERTIDQDPVELAVNASSPHGFDLDVTFWLNGDEVGTDEIESGDRASTSVDDFESGENEWTVEVEDEVGETDSATFSIYFPAELYIRDEVTLDLIENEELEVEIQFFGDETEDVVTRSTTDGTIEMDDLPIADRFIVSVDADGYLNRRVLVESLVQQQDIYLLDEEEDSVFNEFQLIDDTGDFGEDSILIIQKPIDVDGDGSASYQSIVGDRFGADGVVPTDLLRGDTYRLIIESPEGERRSMGSWTAESGGTIELTIGSVSWPAPDPDERHSASIEIVEEDDEHFVRVRFTDPEGLITNLDLTVENRFDPDDILYQEFVSDPSEYQVMIPINESQASQQWALNYSATKDGEAISGYVITGGDTTIPLPLDSWWLHSILMIVLVVTAAMYPSDLVGIGGIVVVALAGVFIMLGWLLIPIPAWFVAGTIAVLGLLRSSERRGF